MKKVLSLCLVFTLLCSYTAFFDVSATSTEINLAATANGGTATSCKTYTDTKPINAIDGVIERTPNWMANAGTLSETNYAWFQSTFENLSLISSVVIYEFYSNNDSNFALSYSADGTTWQPLTATLTKEKVDSLSTSTSATRKRTYTLSTPVVAKHVKMENKSATKMSMLEFEVYGTVLDLSLSTLTLSAGELSPAFDPTVTTYEVTVPSLDDIPQVTAATASDPSASVTITQADATTKKATITVSLGEGAYSLTYTINIVEETEPADVTLASLSADAGVLSPSFDPDVTEYELALPSLDTMPEITATASDSNATVTITQADATTKKATVTVTAADNSCSLTYIITMVKQETNLALAANGGKATSSVCYSNKGAGKAIDGDKTTVWHPNPNSYDETGTAWFKVELSNVSLVEKIIIYEDYSNNKDAMYSNLFASLDGESWTPLSCQMEKTEAVGMTNGRKRVFTLTTPTNAKFVKMVNPQSGTITMAEFEVYGTVLDLSLSTLTLSAGELSPAFDPAVTNYEVTVPSSEAIPQVTATASNSNATVVITQADATTKKATVTVSYGEGLPSLTYTINIVNQVDLKLATLTADAGVLSPSFDPDVTEYELALPSLDTMPVITATASDSNATVTITQADATTKQASVTVTAADGSEFLTYTITMVKREPNLALATNGGTATSCKTYTDTKPINAIDGIIERSPSWMANAGTVSDTNYAWFQSTFENLSLISSVVIYEFYSNDDNNFALSYSVDGTTWQPLTATLTKEKVDSLSTDTSTTRKRTYTLSTPVVAKHVKMENKSTTKMSMLEFEVYGTVLDLSLSTLTLSAGELSPAFDPAVTNYEVTVPSLDAIPQVTAMASNPNATVVITQADATTKKATVTVSLGEDLLSLTYTINIVLDLKLASLSADTGVLFPTFDPGVTNYELTIPSFDTMPVISATAGNSSVTVTITQADATTKKATVTVTAADDSCSLTYIITMVKQETNLALAANGGKATSTAGYTGKGAEQAIDGDLTTVWHPNSNSYDETNPAWFKVELSDVTLVKKIVIYEDYVNNKDAMYSNLFASLDGESWTQLSYQMEKSQALGMTNGRKRVFTLDTPTGAKFVKMVNPLISTITMTEFEVYGEPIDLKLKELTFSEGTLAPEFSPSTILYECTVPSLETMPVVTSAIANNPDAQVEILNATTATNQAKVKVSLGEYSLTYTINILKQDKNWALPEFGTTLTSSRTYTTTGVENAVDGSKSTNWQANLEKKDVEKAWFQAEFQDILCVTRVVVYDKTSNSIGNTMKLQYSFDGKNYYDVPCEETRTTDITTTNGRKRVFTVTEPVGAKYLKVVNSRAGNYFISEFEVNGYLINPYLSSLQSSIGELSPSFNRKIVSYDLVINSKDVLPTISATADDENARVEFVQADLETMEAKVLVTTAGGECTMPYTIRILYPPDNIELKYLTISSGKLEPSFDLSTESYSVTLGPDDEIPVVMAGALFPEVTSVEITQATEENGLLAKVEVVSGNGLFTKTYAVQFNRTGVKLNTLTVGTKELNPAFSPDVLDYSVILEADEALPEVAITIDYALASQTITQATESTMKATVKLVSLEGEEQVYTIYFYRRNNAVDNANLAGIKFSSGSLYEVFDPAKTEFSYVAKDEMNLPLIAEAVTEAAGATAVITQADDKTMTATIVVTSANGNVTKTYKVYYLTNLALGKETYASSAYSPTKPVRATDGIYKTYWGASNGNVKEWIACYLENKGTIRHIRVHENCSGEVKNHYFNHVLKSDDGRNWTEVATTMTVSSYPGREGLNEYYIIEYDFEPFEARYVKITGDDCSRVRLNEIELFGVWEEIISKNAYLKNLELSNGTLTPAFTSYLMDYTVNLGKNDPLPTITKAESVDPVATVTITDATEETPQAQVQVLAEDGVTKRTYSIMMNKEVDPEKDTRLSSISTSAGILEPAFSQNILRYTLYLQPGEVLAGISGQTVTEDASLEIIKEDSQAKLVVTSADGTAQRNYVIAIVYVNAALSTLEVPGAELTPAFDPGVYEYKAELPAGGAIPDVNANPADADAFLSITPATEENMTTIIEVTGAGTNLVKTYKVTFSRRQSLLEGMEAAMEVVRNYQVSETTTATTVMSTIRSAITNGDISLTWSQPFRNQVPTMTMQGLVSGQITIALGGESAVIKINKPYGTLLPGAMAPAGGGGGGGAGGGGAGGGAGSVYNAAVSVTPGDVFGTTASESNTMKNELTGHWAEKEITVLYEKGIVKGNGQSFDLESKINRAEFLSMLVRASGLEKVTYQGIFSDVDKSKWYADDVQMAYNMGLVSGYGDQFGPEDEMSREQASKTLLAFYEMLYGKSEEATVSTFADAHAVSQWAQDSVNRSAALGLIQGYPDNSFRPMAPLTRAQAMVLVYRLCRF